MKAGKYVLIIIGIGIIGFVLYALMQPDTLGTSVFDNDGVTTEKDMLIPAAYTNAAGETVNVEYNNDKGTVTMVRNGETIILSQVISASGARYANEDESIVLWNKGDDVTLYENDVITFEGADSSRVVEEDTNTSSDSEETVNTENLDEEVLIDAALIGTWQWEKTETNSDEGIYPQPKSNKFSLSFDKDGMVSGTTDCNSFGGDYKTQGSSIEFGNMMTTLMFCEDSQESEFLTLINEVNSYMVTNEGDLVLMLKYDSGSIIFSPAKADQV